MTSASTPAIAYIATQVTLSTSVIGLQLTKSLTLYLIQVRFALSSSAVFSRTDTITDSERFYTSLLDFLDSAEEKECIDQLLIWWNRYVLEHRMSCRLSSDNLMLFII